VIFHRRLGRRVYIPTARFEEWLEQGDVEPDLNKIKLQKKVKERINDNKTEEPK